MTLIAALDGHDELLRGVVAGRISVVEFLDQYDNFYWSYALDGHEANPAAADLEAFASRIEPHRRVAEEVLSALAPESSASQPAYILAGRIGYTEALDRLRLIAGSLPTGGA